jgi:hypothetical protein
MYPAANRKQPSQKVTTLMPTGGQNNVFIEQVLKPDQATLIRNYFINKQTELVRRKGSKKLASVSSTTPSVILRKWTDTFYMLGYGTALAAFNINDNTINTIKSDFTATLTDGVRFEDDFYVCNGRRGEQIYKITLPTLAYDAQTANFTVGATLTGGTSGATATIVVDSDSGATGTLTLDNIDGVFQDNETITDSAGGSATANGAVSYATAAIISASSGTVPKCNALSVFDGSLVAIATDTSENQVHLSKKNDPNNWDTSTVAAGDSIILLSPENGTATDSANLQQSDTGIEAQGDTIVIFYKDGYTGFRRNVQANDGIYYQNFISVFNKRNDGGEKNPLSVPGGIFFANENGIFLLRSDGERIELTRNIPEQRIASFDFADVDFAWHAIEHRLYVTFREAAQVNNIMLWFDTDTLTSKSLLWGEITGLAVSRIFIDGRRVFAASSTSPKVMELFPDDVYDDEGVDVYYRYEQPMNFGQFETVKDLTRIDFGGFLSSSAPITVGVFGFFESGSKTDTGINLQWTAVGGESSLSAYGEAEYGASGYGGTPAPSGTTWSPAYSEDGRAYGFKNYVLEFSGNDKSPHVIAYASIQAKETRMTRERGITST